MIPPSPPRKRRTLSETFPALLSPDFRNLWIGQVISAAGSQMQFAALNWLIYDITGSPLALGGIGLVRVIPIVLLSLVGGAVADAYDRRKLLFFTQSLLALVALCLGGLAHYHMVTIPLIYLFTAVGAAAVAFDNPARQALVPSLVPREHLPNAFAINSTGFQVATIVGPVLAGVVIGRYGATVAFFLNAASFGAVLLALAVMRYRPAPVAEGEPAPGFSLASLKEGVAFVRSNKILVSTMTLDFWATFFSSSAALLPIFAKDILRVGPEGFGILSAFPAVGSFLTGSLMTFLPPVVRQGRTILWAVVAYGLTTIGFGLTPALGLGHTFAFYLSALFLAGTGAADTVSTVLRQTVRQTVTPDRLRGRMVSVNMIFFMGGPQLGEMEAGFVAKISNAVVSVVTGGIGCLLTAAAVTATSPRLWHYRLHKPDETETGAVKAA